MLIVRQDQTAPFEKNSVVTVGSFDGVHLAHQALIHEVINRARSRAGRSVVLTFEPHPKQVLQQGGGPIQLLSTLEERIALCESLGVDVFYVIRFTFDFSRQTARQFYEKYVLHGLGVSEVVEGYDHHFGRDREGSVEEIVRLGKEFGFTVTAMKPVTVGEEIVSSSTIRRHLASGNVERANELLGRPYSFAGTVRRGDGRGKALGFPTANLELQAPYKVVPEYGIYFVRVDVGPTTLYGIVSIGVRPTFKSDGERTIEVYLLDFDRDLYGESLTVHFLRRLRDEKKFETTEDLIAQMNKDKEQSLMLVQEFEKVIRTAGKAVHK